MLLINSVINDDINNIESWFQQQWQQTPPPITTSIDLRNAGFKLSPVDTNVFPAGFNNLHPKFLLLCAHAAQKTILKLFPQCKNILLLPENHTRNMLYLENLYILQEIFMQAGFNVRIGSFEHQKCYIKYLSNNKKLMLEPLIRQNNHLILNNFTPCVILLNNDLSNGIPEILQNLKQPIIPAVELGWYSRSKAQHFNIFTQIAIEFANKFNLDPWLLYPYSHLVNNVNFMSKSGIDILIQEITKLFIKIKTKYEFYNIQEQPFVVIKADNGTYGMNVMMINDIQELHTLNRKQRTKMSVSKGGNAVNNVIIQEGVYTIEKIAGAIAEPVIYMIGEDVVGGFYRAHKERHKNSNLNAPGMHFDHGDLHKNNYDTYKVIAKLAALAAAREIFNIKGSKK